MSSDRPNAAYARRVREACASALEAEGFVRFRKDGVDWDLQNGFRCWVGLNTALLADYVEINPFVGLHVVPIEKLWTRLKVGRYPGKYSRGSATTACHMGELAPDERVFRFTMDASIEDEAQRLATLYVRTGLPYVRETASYGALLPRLRKHVARLGAFPERFACCLYLMDRKDEARRFVEEFLPDHRSYFEGFAVPFLEMLDGESSRTVS